MHACARPNSVRLFVSASESPSPAGRSILHLRVRRAWRQPECLVERARRTREDALDCFVARRLLCLLIAARVRLLPARGADVNLAHKDRRQGFTPLMLTSMRGHEAIAKLLCSYGANRDATNKHGYTPITVARSDDFDDLADWLEATRLWTTPLHYLEVVTPPRAAALLRDGADPHARAAGHDAAPSPFELAKAMQAAEGGVVAGSAAALVILEVEGWEAENRQLMTAEARARAEALFGMLGWLMPRFAKGEEVSLKDQWRTRVVPRVLRREFVVG